MDLVFLGTGGSIPTARRATACLLARVGGERLLFDCGEGSQRQMQRSIGLVQVDEIFITHFHADHYLGVPGLLKTYDLLGRDRDLRVTGPPGLIELFGALRRIFGRLNYEVELIELEDGEATKRDGYEVRCFPVAHKLRAHGYALVEDERPGRFDEQAARQLGVEPGPAFGRLQAGEEVSGTAGVVRPDQVMGEPRPGRKVVITGDTAPCEMTQLAAHQAQLLVHDGSFADEETDRAKETAHSTARQAAEIAKAAEAGMLALVHVSSRYDIRAVLAEARESFPSAIAPRDFDLVEIPFPERGAPRLVEGGGRRRHSDDGEPPEAEVRSGPYAESDPA
jgi:ribonuclease Z